MRCRTGTVVATANATYTFTAVTNEVLVANFVPTNYTITVTASPVAASAALLGGTFPAGDSATFIAQPNSGYGFQNWTVNGNVVSSITNYTFAVTSNEALVANFTVTGVTVTAMENPIIICINLSLNLKL